MDSLENKFRSYRSYSPKDIEKSRIFHIHDREEKQTLIAKAF